MKLDIKRKRQGKTDYRARMIMLKSGKTRVIIRKTNKYLNVQLVKSREAKDEVIISVSSRELLKHSWPKSAEGSLKSIPAAYLTGYLVGKRILEKEKKLIVILDIGLARNSKGNRIYAVLNGLVDAGVNIAHDKKVFPNKERLDGKHLKKEIQVIIGKVKEALK